MLNDERTRLCGILIYYDFIYFCTYVVFSIHFSVVEQLYLKLFLADLCFVFSILAWLLCNEDSEVISHVFQC